MGRSSGRWRSFRREGRGWQRSGGEVLLLKRPLEIFSWEDAAALKGGASFRVLGRRYFEGEDIVLRREVFLSFEEAKRYLVEKEIFRALPFADQGFGCTHTITVHASRLLSVESLRGFTIGNPLGCEVVHVWSDDHLAWKRPVSSEACRGLRTAGGAEEEYFQDQDFYSQSGYSFVDQSRGQISSGFRYTRYGSAGCHGRSVHAAMASIQEAWLASGRRSVSAEQATYRSGREYPMTPHLHHPHPFLQCIRHHHMYYTGILDRSTRSRPGRCR
ncbi:hypothetical protein CK203_105454 [Vitis vinifera]|uniref:Uncharacterized protein n=1 Tax=Vitis vinifera TaxID=29760 RepID=A0A438CDQ0_VITVI|nr:hypothetical protein CK203_105454 [Vitis vinifera]